ncbi:MAG: Tn3 family transposase [Gammaproteobacteria bacterium]|nr:Tn3 family transposase [Gammaproteobacteria bacterium]
MSSIERTAYPRFATGRVLKERELEQFYSLTSDELGFINKNIRGDQMRLNFAVQLKTFQRLGYFPELKKIPSIVIDHIKKCLGIFNDEMNLHYKHDTTLYRHRDHICLYLKVTRWVKAKKRVEGSIHTGRHLAVKIAYQTSQKMNHPADIINVVIEELIRHRYELPTFNQLNRLVKHTRSLVNRKIFNRIYQQLDARFLKVLDDLFLKQFESSKTGYNSLKRLPKNPTITHFKELLEHHDWLMSLGCVDDYLQDISKVKLQQFTMEAKSLDASDFKDMNIHRRYTLIICLIQYAQRRAKDALVIMYCRTVAKMHKKADEELILLREQYAEKTKHLLTAFYDVLTVCREEAADQERIEKIMQKILYHGGIEILHDECEQIVAYHSNSPFPLLGKYFAPKRSTLLRLLRVLKVKTASQNKSLSEALQVVLTNAHHASEYIPDEVDISFASKEWQRLICKKDNSQSLISRRYLEMAVISCLTNELRSGDVFIEGANTYSDYRKELLDWESCQSLLDAYCNEVNLPANAKDFVKIFHDDLSKIAKRVDAQYPDLTELVIDEQGNPILKKRYPKQRSQQAIWLTQEIRNRMPERNLLDILCNSHHYTGWAHEFGPITGFDSKLTDPIERYILTNFAYGTCMGSTQAAKHIKADITAHMLSWVNRRHVTPPLLDKALTKIINFYSTFQIINAWGSGQSCAADGTIRYIREENLISEYHIRYGHRGGIAYHHVSDQYIALFSTFIPCGVWEAVEIIEALLKNQSEIKPDTVYSDTQGQSTVVFALAYLFGIKLMPRIRNWKDLTFFRPHKNVKYKHIDSLFTHAIDWNLIETHWPDLMQVVLSIKAGKMSSSLLLRKLSNYSRKNRLYRAFQELGYVVRTKFLLEYISNVELREMITATTNKVEQYNQLSDWTSFGSLELVASNDEDEMEKAVKYNDVVTNSVILQNIVDMSDIIHQLTQEGAQIREDDLARLSPYLTEHIKRFGDYHIDIQQMPNQIAGASKSLQFVGWSQLNLF